MLLALIVLSLLAVTALVVLMMLTEPADPAHDAAALIAAHAEANLRGLEREMSHTPGSWVPAGRTDAAADRLRRERALNLGREVAARAL